MLFVGLLHVLGGAFWGHSMRRISGILYIVRYILYEIEPARRVESNGAIFEWFGSEPTDLFKVMCEICIGWYTLLHIFRT